MALDRPDDDFARPEREVPAGRPDSDVPAMRSEPVEPRSHEEYYEALACRAADADRSGWDSVDAEDRPNAEDIHVSVERTTHILDGDNERVAVTGTEPASPARPSSRPAGHDKRIIAAVLDCRARPDKPPIHQDWNDTRLCTGTRDAVDVTVVSERSGDIWTGVAGEGGPGVGTQSQEREIMTEDEIVE